MEDPTTSSASFVERCISALIRAKWDARLKNWALWKHGVQGDTGVSKAYRSGDAWQWWLHPPGRPQPIIGEAVDTDRQVKQLDADQQEALDAVYVWTYPETMEERAASLRTPISRRMLYYRVDAAMLALEQMDAERRRQIKRRLALVTASGD